MNTIFNENIYHTPNASRKLIDKFFLNTRWYFVWEVCGVLLRARANALKNNFSPADCYQSCLDILHHTEAVGGKFHIEGLDILRNTKEPVVFLSNHMSTLETFVFPGIIGPFKQVSFVIKQSLAKHPIFGPIILSLDPITVLRNNPREDFQQVMEKGKALLEKGTSVVIFPQGTRTQGFNPEEFSSIGIKLAKSVGTKIIPIAVKTDFWAPGKVLKDLGPIHRSRMIHIQFGPPIEISGNGKVALQEALDFIGSHLRSWGVSVVEPSAAIPSGAST